VNTRDSPVPTHISFVSAALFTPWKHTHLLHVLNFTKSPQQLAGTIPNKGIRQVKSDQFSKALAGYKWSQKVRIFCNVKKKVELTV
jgi:hypothetical protein